MKKNERKICFLVGSIAISGGTYVIFQHAAHLVESGYDVTIAVQEAFDDETASWHDKASVLQFLSFDEAKLCSYDLVIATWWKTALELAGFDARTYGYFVQSIESRFYPEEEQPLRALVDSTYRLPVAFVTEAKWIQQYLRERYDVKAALVPNGVRKDIYSLAGPSIAPRRQSAPRILVEGHFGVSFKNTALAIKLARAAGAREIWVLTGSPVEYLPFVKKVFSKVPIEKSAEVYRSCDILVKLSTVEGMFGPPLEMFHCGGTAVVFDVTGHDEYIVDNHNAVVVPGKDTKAVVRQLRTLLNDQNKLNLLKDGAVKTAQRWPNWGESSAKFTSWVEQTIAQENHSPADIENIVTDSWRTYSVDEQQRLAANRSRRWRDRALARLYSSPPRIKSALKKAKAAFEVLNPSWHVR
ncbi:glycosyltransferase family 4 protein [Nitratireductor aquimarinus]|uniref:glycosyltransferase family 4 protein n=1 Tax=Nitratireductor aquimarinus TaxID=889300 RepID=UPI001A8FA7F7|nr:glycosyltransferase family 4 protein [Nitratireductor aquimarinus]MBN8242189.1 glycosyltransferase family 4 protein [Nitratireductor aquimarinus]MBY6130575.1 glycosyltransferase family 4 protein [Nitratireductor aquimarinus]MCA1302669.1 glycosyltransferase family 4 protein [Nitratireductor aquimarinus]